MIHETWKGPSDAMTILLIIGGDVVLQALAQLSGRRLPLVAFSFGWVGYSFNTLMSVVGNGRLMPFPDYEVKIINAQNGFARDNHAWAIGRLLRDFERDGKNRWGERRQGDGKSRWGGRRQWDGKTKETKKVDEAYGRTVVYDQDWCSIIGLGVAAIPCGLDGDWSILVITFAGTILALLTGALPQWRFEKWNCRPNTSKGCCLTRGNGARTVMVIIGCGVGPDLEDMAAAESPRLLRAVKGADSTYTDVVMGLPVVGWITNVSCIILSVAWIVLLITVTAIEQHHWFLLLVGGIGMLQNVLVAGARRSPASRGIHLEQIEEFKGQKVMHALMDVERAYHRVGRSLLAEFFPNDKELRKEETDCLCEKETRRWTRWNASVSRRFEVGPRAKTRKSRR
ncbi:hypothetical protein K435DRAFT_817242 [Dendrothele bispora CBS 962.96]|uniref:Uncharacterized protein n=1 Tax=Dendrothele bispora (strain CBS 962.96) TaxID=1314807 RepID=A0A4S8ML15_DENBC|nr:hypothetical protein K435DRAFT_817242 [Dendrothele bispora CBS 962.96]